MKLRGKFAVNPFTNVNGSESFRVTGTKVTGERVRENFKTEGEAVARKHQLEIESINGDTTISPRVTRLSAAQLADAETAVNIIGGKATLAIVAQFWRENYREALTEKAIGPAFVEFIRAKESENCRPDTIRNLRDRVGRFAKAAGTDIAFESKRNEYTIRTPGKNLSLILPAEVRQFIHAGGSPENKNNERRALSNFFNWCARRGYCAETPMAKIDTIQLDESEPVVMPLDRVRKFVAAASSFKDGKLLPYVALGLFAGMRPKEISRISWDVINLPEKTITLGPKFAKMRGRRVIDMPANLVQWLKPFAQSKASIIPKNFRKDYDVIKAVIGYAGANRKPKCKTDKNGKTVVAVDQPKLEPMAQDILRHTAISNHLAEHQHEGKTATWAGNSPDIIHKSYKGLVTVKEAKQFWNIRPAKSTGKKIIALKQAA
jgi:integrase